MELDGTDWEGFVGDGHGEVVVGLGDNVVAIMGEILGIGVERMIAAHGDLGRQTLEEGVGGRECNLGFSAMAGVVQCVEGRAGMDNEGLEA